MNKYIDININENEYFIWCLLNQLKTNNKKINIIKTKLIKELEKSIFNKIIDNNISNIKLYIRLYY